MNELKEKGRAESGRESSFFRAKDMGYDLGKKPSKV